MNSTPNLPPAQPPGMGVGDIYYILFRHKWKILICAFLGLAAASTVYFLHEPVYQSDAKLIVRYVVTESSTPDPTGQSADTKSPDLRGETIMNAEWEILTSFDLARQVAEAIGPERLLDDSDEPAEIGHAAHLVHSSLTATAPRGSSVIHVTFQHSDPALVQPVLSEVIRTYLRTHHEVHRSVGMAANVLAQETDQLRSRLNQVDEQLRRARSRAGITITVDQTKTEIGNEMARIREEVLRTEAELAERISIVQSLAPTDPAAAEDTAEAPTPEPPAAIPQTVIDDYRSTLARIEQLRARERDLLAQFTEENPRVLQIRTQIAEVESTRAGLEQAHPTLTQPAIAGGTGSTTARGPAPLDAGLESIRIRALQSRVTVLNEQMARVRARAVEVDQAEGEITQLKRERDMVERNYQQYAASLDRSQINERFGTGTVSNIREIQSPSPPAPVRADLQKMLMAIAGGGLVLGLGWAFLIEIFFDHSVRRPIDVERMLGLPLFLSIPKLKAKGGSRKARENAVRELRAPGGGSSSGSVNGTALATREADLVRLENAPLLHSFYETLRDRLIGYFESRNLTHKPKLVAVTGLDLGAGVTTTAAGLASCLSETGEGNVLLVDMTAGQGSAQQFYRGKEVCGLDEILSARDSAQVQDNLFVVVEEPGKGDRLSRILPQRFSKLVPQLKTSNFDYIIFDMPPVSQISITPRLAGFMDMVLLVIESEKTNRELVQRATALLAESKAHVGAVLNKTKTYVPRKLHQDTLSNF